MARVRICVLILVILGMMTTGVSSQPAGEDQAIMQVVVANAEGFYRRGTAFHVGNGIFYTNVHVVRDQVPEGFTEWYLAGTNATRSQDTWLGPFSVTCVSSAVPNTTPRRISTITAPPSSKGADGGA